MAVSPLVTLSVSGMSCASCTGRVAHALESVPGVGDVSVNLATETVSLSTAEGQSLTDVADTLEQLGYPARESTVTLDISGMNCGACVGRIDKALTQVPGVRSVSVNLANNTATLAFLDKAVSVGGLEAASSSAGYPATARANGPSHTAEHQADQQQKDEDVRNLKRNVLIAVLLALPVLLLEMGSHMVPAFHKLIHSTLGMQNSWLIQCLLTTAILLGPGRRFFAIGIPALLKRAPDMNSLVAVGTGAAWVYSVVATFIPAVLPSGTVAVYFESAAVIVTLILIGRWMEARAKGKTGAAIQSLLALQPEVAAVMRDGEFTEVAISALVAGDRVRVRPGERIPIDGNIIEGNGYIDESMITGESAPVLKTAGSNVTGGTINGSSSFVFTVTHVGADTTLARIIQMVEEAQGTKLPIQNLVNRVTFWFVPAVIAFAALTILCWLVFGGLSAFNLALIAAVSVLIIACPCAMGLATPTSIMVGTGRAAEMGVLFRKGDALQTLSNIDFIAFDKTGTITEGRPALTDLITTAGASHNEVLGLVASLETQSEHPVGVAIVNSARTEGIALSDTSDFQSHTGFGIEGTVSGRHVLAGAERLMQREGIDNSALVGDGQRLASLGRSLVYVAIDRKLAAVIAVSDPLKASSKQVVAELRKQGFEVAMITGDKRETAEVIAAEAGIDQVIAGVLPDGKVTALEQLRSIDGQHPHRTVAFVGDGINDAPALASADVGIAIGSGTDIAIDSAEVILMSGDLRGVINALAVAKKTMANIRQNLGWAFAYNVLLIPLAAGILYPVWGLLLSPVFAAAAMAMSSVSVLLNSLRLYLLKPVMTDAVTENNMQTDTAVTGSV